MMDRIDSKDLGLWGDRKPQTTWPTRLVGGVLATLGLLLLLALLTYRSAEVGWDALRPAGQEAQEGCSNWLGGVGLYTAAILYWLLGAGALYGVVLLQVPAWDMLLYPVARRRGQWIALVVMFITSSWAMAVQPWILSEWTQHLGLRSAGGWIGYLGGSIGMKSVMGIYWTLEVLIVVHAVALIYLARLTPKALYDAEKQELRNLIAHWQKRRELARELREKQKLAWRLEDDGEFTPMPHGQKQSNLPIRLSVPQQLETPLSSNPAHSFNDEPGESREESREREGEHMRHAQVPPRAPARSIGGKNLLDLNDDADDDAPLNFRTPPLGEEGTGQDDDLPELNPNTRALVRHFDTEKATQTHTQVKKTPKPVNKPKRSARCVETELEDYPLPPYELLNYKPVSEAVREQASEEMHKTQALIIDALESFNIPVQPGDITRGPSVTRYEFSVPRGQSVKAVAGKSKDIMAATQSTSVNILAPIPGKSTVGVELENTVKEPVYLRELLQSPEFHNPKMRIPVALGKDVYGNPVIGDLAAMPHVLVAGSTGSGKSVCINSMLVSLLYKFRPDELRLVLVDPKVVEMQPYKKLPHLAVPVVTDPTRVISALRWAVNEMEHRYKLFSKMGVRNLEDYNNLPPDAQPVDDADDKESHGRENPDAADAIVRDVMESQGLDLPPDDGQEELDFEDDGSIPTRLPYIVIVIDELADLMMQVKQDLEIYIGRLTQKARAAGLHLIVATQSPRAQVVTGIIKTNLPSRIALKVSSQLDSRVILDEGGAENLLGKGDLLYLPPGGPSKMARAQGAFVSDAEIASIISHCASHARQNFVQSATAAINDAGGETDSSKSSSRSGGNGSGGDDEELYTRCVNLVVTERKASTSLLQRRFSIGYGKAAKMIDMMEERGVISPAGGANRAREVLVDKP